MGASENQGPLFSGGPHKKDHNDSGPIVRILVFCGL